MEKRKHSLIGSETVVHDFELSKPAEAIEKGWGSSFQEDELQGEPKPSVTTLPRTRMFAKAIAPMLSLRSAAPL